jgi:pyruvate dehydrogenase E1 component beta subunit
VAKTGRVVIVHEAPRTCGFGAELAATIAEEAILSLRGPVLRVAGPDVPVPLAKLVEHYLPDTARIRAAVEELLRY